MRLSRILGAALTGLLMTGCSGSADSTPNPGPNPALPADEMVLTVTSAGGLVPPVFDALDSPELAIYGDGRVLTMVRSTELALVPARYEVARVDPAAVASLVSGAQSGSLFDPGTDFGSPRVTDLAVTTVTVRGPQGHSEAGAYAIDEQFDRGLTAEQRNARASLRALIAQAGALAAGVAHTQYSPNRVAVYEFDPQYANGPATVGWPGPPPSSFLTPSGKHGSIACGLLTADPAEVVYQAALENSGGRWLVNGTARVLAVNPLPLPDSCP